MAQYSIGQVVELTGIKPHILRYWEEVIPSFSPKKDFGGRRMYSQRDIDFLFRLKYLIYNKNYTIESARFKIIRESISQDRDMDSLQEIHEIRQILSETYFMVQKQKELLNEEKLSRDRTQVVRKKTGYKA